MQTFVYTYRNQAVNRLLTSEKSVLNAHKCQEARYYDSDIARFLSTDPWQQKYPSWSTYNYVMGNPVMFVDPSGKGVETNGLGAMKPNWASQSGYFIHQIANNYAVKDLQNRGLIKNEHFDMIVNQLNNATVYADGKKFQQGKYAYRHAMRTEGQSVEEASQLANDFVRERYNWALDAYESGDYEKAYFNIGVALHTIQDATSPAHGGFQLWTGEEGVTETTAHIAQEIAYPGTDSNLHTESVKFLMRFVYKAELPEGNLFNTIKTDK